EGSIHLPPGAEPAHPWAWGRAFFAFLAEGGSGRPFAGITELTFLRGGFLFVSTRVETLAVTDDTVVYRGTGWVNGRGGFAYTVTAVCNRTCGNAGADELRVQVTDTRSGDVVFDTNPGGDPGETTPIQTGFVFVQSF